jgi:ATP-dependent helicase/nuclease subunit B
MAVEFILGRSGTGKTTHCLGAIVEALGADSELPLILLVPEQATYQAERAILSDPRVSGYHRLQIISFNRLQFFLAGRNTVTPRISNIGRQMMVHKILRDSRDDLHVFRSSAMLPGFAREIANTITELHRYAKGPEDLVALETQLQAEKGNRLAALKFADISRIFRRYTEVLEDRFVDPEAQAGKACEAVADAEFLRGARLWVDGFAGFTGAEIALLIELLKVVGEAHIALCLDPAGLGPKPAAADGLFEPTERTYQDLCEMIRGAKIELRKPVLLEKARRFGGCQPLAHVEKNLFQFRAKWAKAGDAIRLASAPSLRAEVQFVAGQIRHLVQEKGYRYRDIAVVASDLGHYEHYVRAYFDDYAIPFFIDQRQPLNQHPVVELITAALQVVTGGFKHADLFAYLKTDLVPMASTDVDVLENYCLAFGIDGRDWTSPDPWRFQGSGHQNIDEQAINRIRSRAAQPLLELKDALDPKSEGERTLTAGDFTRAVFGLLDGLHVREAVSEWVEEAHGIGDLATADEHRQFYDKLIDIFDELVAVFEHETMSSQDYLAILSLAFSQMTLAFIPPSLDQVLVGSIERSRHPSLRAVFLLGATQRQFPIPVPSSGVLTDADRDAAEAVGFHLAPTTIQSLAERQYLAYIAFTRPSEFLCISYPAVDEKGSPVVRSHFVDELVSLFDDLAEESLADGRSEIADVHTQPELAELLCSRLGRDAFAPATDGDALPGLLEALRADADCARTAEAVRAALDYDNRAALSGDVVERLFGKQLQGSATKLATFAACPFKYFVRYTLQLKPRKEFKLEPLDLGNFYHAVLDALHKRLVADGQNFASADDDRLIQLLREQIEAFASQDPFISKFRSRSDHNAFIISNASEVLEECVLEIAQMARAGAFEPVLSEVAFGEAREGEESLGSFELPLPNGGVLTLSGKIDRMDVAEVDGRRVALVFDYKRTKAATTFNWSQFYHGLNIQLPMYLLALSEVAAAQADRVAGAFCLPIEKPPESAGLDELAQKSDRFGRKAKGLFNGEYASHLDPNGGSNWNQFYNFCITKGDAQYGRYATSGALKPDDFERVLKFTRDKMIALAADIMGGHIDVHPYRLGTQAACSYCDFKAVCRFDWQINDYNFLDSKSKSDVAGERNG